MLLRSSTAATNGREVPLVTTDLLRITRTEHAAQTRLPPHSHDVATIAVVLGGGYWENLGTGERNFPPMAAVVKPAHVSHSNRVDGRGARCLLFEFPQQTVDELSEVGNLFASARTIDLTRSAALALRILVTSRETFYAEALSMQLVAVLNSEIGHRHHTSGQWLERVRDRLHHDLDCTSLTLRRLAKDAGYHPVYLSRAFKRRFGESIGSYLHRVRIARTARDVAEGSRRSLSEIAQRCGYHDHSHMSHDFRMRTGMSPAQWRNLSRK